MISQLPPTATANRAAASQMRNQMTCGIQVTAYPSWMSFAAPSPNELGPI